jgi:hypothetical protein
VDLIVWIRKRNNIELWKSDTWSADGLFQMHKYVLNTGGRTWSGLKDQVPVLDDAGVLERRDLFAATSGDGDFDLTIRNGIGQSEVTVLGKADSTTHVEYEPAAQDEEEHDHQLRASLTPSRPHSTAGEATRQGGQHQYQQVPLFETQADVR